MTTITNAVLQAPTSSISPDPNERQKRAATPQHDVWVAASAGSGKTTVLTNRVLRLLLPDQEGKWEGSPPHKILCITFTKAAAALMSIRIQNRLGNWATMTDEALEKDLKKLTGTRPSPETMTAARELFTKVLDVPGGMSIMTIHSFCQSVLGRFPLEAGLTPGFQVFDEPRAKDLLSRTILSLVTDIERKKRPDLEPSFERIALSTDFEVLKSILLSLLDQSRDLSRFLDANGTGETLYKNLLGKLGLEGTETKDSLLLSFSSSRPENDLREAAKTLGESKTSTNKKIGQGIADWLALSVSDRGATLDNYRAAILTTRDERRKLFDKIEDNRPDIVTLLENEQTALLETLDKIASLDQARATADLLTLGGEVISSYKTAKRHHNALDFGDLISGTRDLLEQKGEDWVHFKLDEGIDHILVDEAQDTNIHQWKIIEYLSKELQSGLGRETKTPRSLFVVGDKKQSIFSFHGADPAAFTRMRHFFEDRSKNAERIFDSVTLDTSFRTTRPVLDLVDRVFADSALARKLGLEDNETLVHYSGRRDKAGKVELWDVIKKEQNEKKDTDNKLDATWALPFSKERGERAQIDLKNPALMVAEKIRKMIARKEILPSTGRPVEPRDILVLVRTRTGPFIADLIRQLKIYKIEVSGIDRMTLRDQIAVEDCLALAKFARLPSDDLSLACVLKSPFIRITEEELMNLALDRGKGTSLWNTLKASADEKIVRWLEQKIGEAATLSPFDFFNEALSCSTPYDPEGSARRGFAQALGPDCIDPLDEFLSYCLKVEQDGITGLENFVTHMEKTELQIKRDSEDSEKENANQVRIMTVHGSKGLEAPIIFLPDTTSLPAPSKTPKLLWVEDKEGEAFPLWAPASKEACTLYREALEAEKDKEYEEYLRLLYVALTRPRDQLYISGHLGTRGWSKSTDKRTWYQLVEDAFGALENVRLEGDKRIYEIRETTSPKEKQNTSRKITKMPDWLPSPPPPEKDPRHFVQPSLLGKGRDAALSPLQAADEHRFERGNLTHRLFQFLPDIPVKQRKKSAELFLSKSGKRLPEEIRRTIVDEVLSVLENPVFAPVFGPDSLAEVPVTGEIGNGRILSGQIDRLVIEKDRILIVDFKSNRPSPKNEADIPQEYRDQLQAYKSAISMIYKDKPIDCALLWTDRAILMPITL